MPQLLDSLSTLSHPLLMYVYVGDEELLRIFPFWGRFILPYEQDLESGRYVLTGQSAGWALERDFASQSEIIVR